MTSLSQLAIWQKRQAALLYLFASDEYLKGLQIRVHEIQSFVDEVLDRSRAEERDQFIRNSRWGERDTSENWSNHAWSFLADFGLSVSRHLADRASEIYHVTGAYQCGRGMSEFSMDWTTPTEQETFDSLFASITNYAGYIDKTMDRSHRGGRWTDFGFVLAWEKHAAQFLQMPRLIVREDITCMTNEIPSRTGVYVSSDFSNASLQFAWRGNEYGKLRECSIFNELGQRALDSVGRSKLWLDDNAMLTFVQKNANAPELIQDPFYSASPKPHLASSLVARNAFTSAPTKWYFVELLNGQFESIEDVEDVSEFKKISKVAGTPCELSGFYFTPAASASRRHFKQGDIFPSIESTYGNAIWQWDERQS